jgi:hypothetical protein
MADEAPAAPAGSEPKKKTNLVPILIVIGVIVVVIIGVGVWKLTSSDSSSTAASGPPPIRLAKDLYNAWQANDRTAAAADATPAAVTQIFAIPASDGEGLTFGGCSRPTNAQFPKACIYTRPGGQLTMSVNPVAGKRTITKVELGAAGLPPDTTG